MSTRSLNMVMLIGNLTRDPELRYTPQGTAVCSFGLATNRSWVTDVGDKKEDVEFHRIVAWSKLAELCAQLLKKGSKVYLQGRLQTRHWQGEDGMQRSVTEVVISEMIVLDSRNRSARPVDSYQDEYAQAFVAETADDTGNGQVVDESTAPAPQSQSVSSEQSKEQKTTEEKPNKPQQTADQSLVGSETADSDLPF